MRALTEVQLGGSARLQRLVAELLHRPLGPELPATKTGTARALVGAAEVQLRAIGTAIDAAQRVGGATPLRALPTRVRQRLDQSVGAALQTLSAVPDLLGIGGS